MNKQQIETIKSLGLNQSDMNKYNEYSKNYYWIRSSFWQK